jgi:hypothetical protein
MYVISASVPSHWNAAISDLLPADYWDTYLTYLYLTLPYLPTLPIYSPTTHSPPLPLSSLLLGRGLVSFGPGIHLPYLPPFTSSSTEYLSYVNSLPALLAPYAIRA